MRNVPFYISQCGERPPQIIVGQPTQMELPDVIFQGNLSVPVRIKSQEVESLGNQLVSISLIQCHHPKKVVFLNKKLF